MVEEQLGNSDSGDSVPAGVVGRRRLEPMHLGDLLALQSVGVSWVVDELVPSGGITLLTGEPGAFKTWLLLELALCVAEGRAFFGQFQATSCPVLYIDEENGEGLLKDRLAKLGANGSAPVYFTCFDGFKLKPPDVERVLDECKRLGVKVVIIDSLVRVHNARDENDAAAMSAAFEQLTPLRKAGISIVFAHHHGKRSGGEGLRHAIRGSSDILAVAQSHLAIELGPNRVLKITQTKSRQGEEAEPFKVEVGRGEDGTVEFEFVGKVASTSKLNQSKAAILEVLRLVSSPPSQQELIAKVLNEQPGLGDRTVRTAIDELVTGGGLIRQRGKANSYLYSLPDSKGGGVAKTSTL